VQADLIQVLPFPALFLELLCCSDYRSIDIQIVEFVDVPLFNLKNLFTDNQSVGAYQSESAQDNSEGPGYVIAV
jgi:hypothetical protein